MVSDGEIVLDIDGNIVSPVRLCIPVFLFVMQLVIPFFRKCDGRQGLRKEGMINVLGAELHQMAGRRDIVEIRFPAPVPYTGDVIDVEIIDIPHSIIVMPLAPHSGVHPHPIMVEGEGRIREQLTGEHMVPTERDHVVPPADSHSRAVETVRFRVCERIRG